MENEPQIYNPDQLIFDFNENDHTSEPRTVHFNKELFDKLLADGERIYDWFTQNQKSLHGMDPEFEHKLIK